MAEPVIYAAAAESLKADTSYLRDYVPPPARLEERDPIWNFEQIPNALQEQTDLRGWMQKTKEDRMDIVKKFTREFVRRQDEDPTSLGLRRQKTRRKLLYVIVTEAASPLGSREVAAEAFKAVFPKE